MRRSFATVKRKERGNVPVFAYIDTGFRPIRLADPTPQNVSLEISAYAFAKSHSRRHGNKEAEDFSQIHKDVRDKFLTYALPQDVIKHRQLVFFPKLSDIRFSSGQFTLNEPEQEYLKLLKMESGPFLRRRSHRSQYPFDVIRPSLPKRKVQEIGLSSINSRYGERLKTSSFLDRSRKIHAQCARRSDPDIRACVIDDYRGCVNEIQKHSRLNFHEQCREGDANKSNRKTQLIVYQIVPAYQERHAGPNYADCITTIDVQLKKPDELPGCSTPRHTFGYRRDPPARQ